MWLEVSLGHFTEHLLCIEAKQTSTHPLTPSIPKKVRRMRRELGGCGAFIGSEGHWSRFLATTGTNAFARGHVATLDY